jgi:glycosyltransferase involved in cell wall biosynthesis
MERDYIFTVVIPTLNEEDYLPRLLSDLVRQKEHAFEVVVVDGGSQDKTVAVAQEYAKRLPLRVIQTKRGNVCVQRNQGASIARGEYLVFFDADVQLPQRFLYELHRKIKETGSEFLTTYLRADSHNMYDKTIARFFNLNIEIAKLVDHPFVGGFNFIVKKSVFEKIGKFNPQIVHAEDFDLSLRVHKAGHELTILRKPRIIFSLRRFRHEGRLATIRKNATAAVYIFTKGPITREIFSYPMGGLWYKLKRKEQIKPQALALVEGYVKRFIKLLVE